MKLTTYKMDNKKIVIGIFVIVLVSFAFSLVSAHSDETFLEAEHLIEEQIPCDELTDSQLEAIGDYYMEQMHPGEQHEYMDEIMGGEGSESLEAMHINMALSIYCDSSETEYRNIGYGMMGMMSRNYWPGMMQGYYWTQSSGFQWLPFSIVIVIVLLIILIALQIQKK